MSQRTYMAQLDGLRAIAVSAVVIHHFGEYYFSSSFPAAAAAGVRLFFVLSGFLITGILLEAKDRITLGQTSTGEALKNFLVRRVLRIFPVYYLIVLITFICDVGPARELIWWLLTYTLNLKMASQGWFIDTFPHFWSLNVEEQFYVLWPWVVLLLPLRWLVPAAIVMIATAPAGKVAYVLSGYTLTTGIGTYVSTWACLDVLGAGALIAILRHRGSRMVDPNGWPVRTLALVGMGVLLLLRFWPLPGWDRDVGLVLEGTAQAAVFSWVLLKTAEGFRGHVGAALQWRPAAFVGRISYGIYVYHLFIPGLLTSMLLGRRSAGWPAAMAAVACTLAISLMSWHLMERPINRLKDRFR